MYPKSVEAKVGESVQFACIVSGFGQNYNIVWYNDHNFEKPILAINHSHVLDIPVAHLSDSGSYYCAVKNESGAVMFTSNISTLQVIGTAYMCRVDVTMFHIILSNS